MDIKIETEEFNFKFRVSGVIINNDKVLLVDMDKSGFLCFPGGYYLLEPVDEIETLNFSLVEKGEYRDTMLDFKWINIENLDKYDIRPKIMKDILKENKIEFKHLVVKE